MVLRVVPHAHSRQAVAAILAVLGSEDEGRRAGVDRGHPLPFLPSGAPFAYRRAFGLHTAAVLATDAVDVLVGMVCTLTGDDLPMMAAEALSALLPGMPSDVSLRLVGGRGRRRMPGCLLPTTCSVPPPCGAQANGGVLHPLFQMLQRGSPDLQRRSAFRLLALMASQDPSLAQRIAGLGVIPLAVESMQAGLAARMLLQAFKMPVPDEDPLVMQQRMALYMRSGAPPQPPHGIGAPPGAPPAPQQQQQPGPGPAPGPAAVGGPRPAGMPPAGPAVSPPPLLGTWSLMAHGEPSPASASAIGPLFSMLNMGGGLPGQSGAAPQQQQPQQPAMAGPQVPAPAAPPPALAAGPPVNLSIIPPSGSSLNGQDLGSNLSSATGGSRQAAAGSPSPPFPARSFSSALPLPTCSSKAASEGDGSPYQQQGMSAYEELRQVGMSLNQAWNPSAKDFVPAPPKPPGAGPAGGAAPASSQAPPGQPPPPPPRASSRGQRQPPPPPPARAQAQPPPPPPPAAASRAGSSQAPNAWANRPGQAVR